MTVRKERFEEMIALDICTSAHPVKNFLPIEIFV